MIRSLWTAKTGLDAQQTNLDIITNNLANNQTIAFKAARPQFSDLAYQTLRAPGLTSTVAGINSPTNSAGGIVPSGLQVGSGSRLNGTQRITTPGALVVSQSPLSVAITGDGYFQVGDGTSPIGYTRAGNFQRDANGNIVTSSGYQVLSKTGTAINLPATANNINISSDGVVSYYQANLNQPINAGQLGFFTFLNPNGLFNSGGDVYYQTPASGAPISGTPGVAGLGQISQYYTEQSNVNVAEELVSLIAAQRAYEITTRAVSASDNILQKLGQL